MFGEITNPALAAITDLEPREVLIFRAADRRHPLLGLQPDVVFHITNAAARSPCDRLSRRVGPVTAMTFNASVILASPELVLAVSRPGAAGLGGFRRPGDRAVFNLAGDVGARACGRGRLRWPAWAGPSAGGLIADEGAVFAKVVIYAASAVAIPAGRPLVRPPRHRAFRVSGSGDPGRAGHGHDGLGRRPDLALRLASSCSRWRSISWPPSGATTPSPPRRA